VSRHRATFRAGTFTLSSPSPPGGRPRRHSRAGASSCTRSTRSRPSRSR